MGLRDLWSRLVGDSDRLEREEDAIREAGSGPPAPLEDYEAMKDDVLVRERDLPGVEAAEVDERGS
ncbi:MAG: hypothetical protein ACXWYS_03020 [Gaiellaceae bacterium]